MFIKYKTNGINIESKKSNRMIRLFLLLTLVFSFGKNYSQISPVNININVTPPYSSAVYDYINNPNKVIISLTHTQLDYPDIELYLKATITGENGIKIATEEGYKPSQPILLQRGKTYRLTADNISDAFSENHINTTGITLNELLNGAGLPEGGYQICVQAFDFKTDRPISSEEPIGCSNIFTITNLEPPIIVTPQCGDNCPSPIAQMVNINWTIPAGALSPLSYRLEMIEIPENSQLDPREAFETSGYPYFYEESTRINQTILTSQKVTLTNGYTYAFRVKAEDPLEKMNIRNKGYSEVCWFTYNKDDNRARIIPIKNDSISFVFITPKQTSNNNADTLDVNNEKNLLINWCWLKNIQTTPQIMNSEIANEKNLLKYVLNIDGIKGKNFKFKRELSKTDNSQAISQVQNADSLTALQLAKENSYGNAKDYIKSLVSGNGQIPVSVQLTEQQALDAGFTDGQEYVATIETFDFQNISISKATQNFVFRQIKDEVPMFKIPIQAVINYGFENYPDIFPVSNSEVIIEALRKRSKKLNTNKVIKNSQFFSDNLPCKSIKGTDYIKINSIVAKTNSEGKLDTLIGVPQQYFETDSVAFSIRLANNYYVDNEFEQKYLTLAEAIKKEGINFGPLTAKTYAYTLKVNVRKEFTSYTLEKDANSLTVSLAKDDKSNAFNSSTNEMNDKKQSHTDFVGRDTIAENIPVVLYRINKQETIPYYEGDIDKSNSAIKNKFNDITVVAFGTTQLEKDSTFVTFNKLLATNNPQEEYNILAIKDLNSFLSPTSVKKSGNSLATLKDQNSLFKNAPGKLTLTGDISDLLAEAIKNYTQGSQTNFIDSGKFVASVKPYHFKLPANTNAKDAYYRTAKVNYTITSCTPPTSRIKGQLLYEWKSDVNMVKRPLSNTHFRVVVDYVDEKGRSVGIVKNSGNSALANIIGGSWEYTVFQPDNQNDVIPLVDQYATMAEGVTDNDGNFTIDAVNINKKGNLGSGSINSSSGSSKPPVSGQSEEEKLKEIKGGDDVINPIESSLGQFGIDQGASWSKQSKGIQNSINGGVFNIEFNSGTSSYELSNTKSNGKQLMGMANVIGIQNGLNNAHGPNCSELQANTNMQETQGIHYPQFRRTFRIVIDGDNADYYYPSNKVIEIQPSENMSTPVTLIHYVREFKLLVKTAEINQKKDTIALSQVQVTLFRDAKDKSKHLPLGEGDGKYTYKELMSPIYDSQNSQHTEYEQLWPSQSVEQIGNSFGKLLGNLIQSENDRNSYFIQASSYVNTGNKAYQATIVPLGGMIDETDDWDAPKIPEVKCTVVLKPLLSRALVLVRDSLSGQILTKTRNTKVILSQSPVIPWVKGNQNSMATDQYGYAEFIAGQAPLTSDYLNKPVYFAAMADGFTFGNQPLYKTENFYQTGYQSTPRLSLMPTATVKGRVINADAFSYYGPGSNNQSSSPLVKAYIQADSSKVFETDDSGNFEMPIAPKAGVKIKIIPKDVAWFDTTYVLSLADEKKSKIELGDIPLYRRKHRIQFNITQKMPSGFVGPATPVNGATIQLGENMMTTSTNGTSKFVFENVSVNNYTFIVRGPKGGGYIPKTVSIKNYESREFQQKNVVLEKGSEVTGTVTLDNKPVKNARVYIEVNNTNASQQNYSLIPQSYSLNSSQTSGGKTAKVTTGVANSNLLNISDNLGLQPTGSITDDANLVVTRTDTQGKFKLQGIPVDNQKINIIATIDTTFTVSGDKQQVNIVNGKGTLNLNMTSFGDMVVNKLYGFPLTLEKITPVNETQIKVTGLVNWTEAISDFVLKDNNKALRVEDVLFDITKTGSDPANAVVHDNSVKIPGITSLKLSYNNKYNIKLTAFGETALYNSTPLQFTRENDFGKLNGRMQIVDNSFNYPSSYLDFKGSDFYLARLNNDSTLNHQISVATSAFTQTESINKTYRQPEVFKKEIDGKMTLYKLQPVPVYYLCNQSGNALKFKLINFTASANPKKSYISSDGKIHLNTTLTCHIDHAKPEDFSVNIPDMVLDENKVYPATSAKPINVKLEDWNLEARNWSFSTTEGGLLSNKATIRTKIIDIPVGKFVLRADKFIMEDYKLDSLSMGGGKFLLRNIQKGAAHLNYEYKVGHDMGAHWNFCLVGSGNTPVASLPPLTGLSGYNIDLNYIEILSNDEMVVQLMQKNVKPNLLGNPVAQFEPLSIFNGPNYIGVSGLLNTNAPRMGEINLTANWSSKNENPKFENVITDFEGKGFVHFVAEKQKIDINENQVVIEGSVLEKPDLTFNPMPAKFYARKAGNPKYEVAIDKGWKTLLSEEEKPGTAKTHSSQNSSQGYSLTIDKGGMTADDKDWSTLTYEGPMTKNSTGSEDITPTKVKFEVLGDVSAKSDGLSVTGISTPFGSMSQVFDFKKKQLTGTLSIDKAITLGAVRINSGVIETCFGVPGFYVAGGCNSFISASLLTGTYNLGFMAGNYTNQEGINRAWDVTNNYIDQRVVNKCYKTNTLDQQKLHGVYIAVNRELLNVDLSWDFILASGYIRALALIGGDFYANFSKTSALGVDGYVYIDAGAGLSCITGTSINGGILGRASFGAQLEASPSFKMTVNGSLNLGFNASISQSLLFTTISKDISIGCCLEATVDSQKNTSFDFHRGGCSDSGCNEKSNK